MTDAGRAATFLAPSHFAGYALLCLIWGSTWLAIRILVQFVPPFEAAGIRFVIVAIVLLGLARLQKRPWPRDEAEWKATAVLGLAMMAVPFGLLFWAERSVASSMAAVLYSASPLTISLFTPLMMHQTVPRRAVLSMAVAFGGILVLLYSEPNTSSQALLGYAAILGGMVLSAWSLVYAKLKVHQMDPVVSTGLQLLFGSIMLGWGSWALESHQHAMWNSYAVIALAFLTLVGSCVGYVVYYWLLKHMQPYQLGTISLVIPVIALLEGWLMAREPLRWMMLLVIVVILASVGTALRADALAGREIEALALSERAQ